MGILRWLWRWPLWIAKAAVLRAQAARKGGNPERALEILERSRGTIAEIDKAIVDCYRRFYGGKLEGDTVYSDQNGNQGNVAFNTAGREDYMVSQPRAFGDGRTVVRPETTAEVVEEGGELVVLDTDKGVSIGEIANALNAIGATPRDLIAIFQAIKASGSLHGELIIL